MQFLFSICIAAEFRCITLIYPPSPYLQQSNKPSLLNGKIIGESVHDILAENVSINVVFTFASTVILP